MQYRLFLWRTHSISQLICLLSSAPSVAISHYIIFGRKELGVRPFFDPDGSFDSLGGVAFQFSPHHYLFPGETGRNNQVIARKLAIR